MVHVDWIRQPTRFPANARRRTGSDIPCRCTVAAARSALSAQRPSMRPKRSRRTAGPSTRRASKLSPSHPPPHTALTIPWLLQDCFRCKECNKKLQTDWCVEPSSDTMYCKAHFMQLIKTSGVVSEHRSTDGSKGSQRTSETVIPQPASGPAPTAVPVPSVAALVAAAAAAPAATVPDAAPKAAKLRRAMSFGGGGGEKCHSCRKTVYAAEKATAQGNTFHQACFRCTECSTKLTANSWCVDSGGRLFCKAHFLQLLRAGGGDYSLGGTKETSTDSDTIRA